MNKEEEEVVSGWTLMVWRQRRGRSEQEESEGEGGRSGKGKKRAGQTTMKYKEKKYRLWLPCLA
jgi:hypothetical protein